MDFVFFNDAKLDGFEKQIINYETGEKVYLPTPTFKFNRVNIFVGSNNSGKSRLMRHAFLNITKDCYFKIGQSLAEPILTNTTITNLLFEVYKTRDHIPNLLSFLDNHFMIKSNKKSYQRYEVKCITLLTFLQSLARKGIVTTIDKTNKIFIPLLRGMNPLNDNGKDIDLYRQRVLKQYFSGEESLKENIFTGQSIYNVLKEMLLGDHNQRETVKQYENFLSKNIFEGKDITLIPKIKKDNVTVKIGNEQEREIHELGDGIQSLIILTFPMFMNKDKDMVFFIEEPEINMHPGMQRVFFNAIQNEGFKNHQYFITTHSNHLLDMSFNYEEVTIFMFKKLEHENGKKDFRYELEQVKPGSIEMLEQLGVKNSSVFQSNCTIWVEGITDVYIIREYINRELKNQGKEGKYVENLHYSFVEYGGACISHLRYNKQSEDTEGTYDEKIDIGKISNKPIIVADFDREEKHEKRIESLGDVYYYMDEVKELENTLSEEILLKIIEDYEGGSVEFNSSINDFEYQNYKNIPIGDYINSLIKDKKRNYASGNTISDKVNFAKKARKFLADETISYEEAMSQSAKTLAKKLVAFIEQSNKEIANI